ncbi:hypothetical protein T439DRAFT_356673 [Meredithblackwellia eburnea MCA 4105]
MSTALQDASLSRKEKLAMLKKRKQLHDSGDAPPANGEQNGDKPEVFRFRNYDPNTGEARKHARLEEEDTVEKQVEGLAEKVILEDELRRGEELDLTNIMPKKANWDLKRDLDRKLSKLRSKTDQAVAVLIRKRLAEEKGKAGGEGDMAAIVAGGTMEEQEVEEAGSDEE